ncbi:MAG TPA: N-acetylglucosamine-6-phosphate deacetylase [Puia sp.]|nr:N-acetylglucosamine-6-phosphate deacetylase [Puia sp.]
MSQATLKIINGRILLPDRILEGGTVVVEGEVISAIGEGAISAPGARVIDAEGRYVSPGFIDMHVHGGGGFDFMDGSEAACLVIAETHARYGTTAMLPTTLTGSGEELLDTLAVYERALPKNTRGAQWLGMHLEGPYFAMNQRGAQDPRYIRDPDPAEYRKILEKAYLIKRWSAAPELKGAIDFAHYAREKGVLVSMAHTDAIYEEALEGFKNGYTLATHLYSGMSGVTRRNAYRYAGVVEAAFLIDDMDVEIIADGVHLPPPLLQLVYKIKGAARTALITDAMRAAGLPPGESVLGNIHHGLKVIVEDGVAKLPDRSAFAGSVATADRLVRTMVREAGISLREAVRMITATPASILGVLDRKGILAPGKDADIVLFDEDIQIHSTIIKGEVIYENK